MTKCSSRSALGASVQVDVGGLLVGVGQEHFYPPATVRRAPRARPGEPEVLSARDCTSPRNSPPLAALQGASRRERENDLRCPVLRTRRAFPRPSGLRPFSDFG